MKAILIVTTLWQGNPAANTYSFEMPSMAVCEKKAAEWHRDHGNMVTTMCLDQSFRAISMAVD
jgi:hypothetical protein